MDDDRHPDHASDLQGEPSAECRMSALDLGRPAWPPDAAPADLPGGPALHRFASPEPAARPPELELRAVMQQSRAPLRSLFRSYGIRPDDAEDILQEALLVVVGCWRMIDDPLPFLLGTVKHRIQAYLQQRRGERAALVELARRQALVAGDVPQRRVDSREDARRLLAQLPDGSRRIVAMRYGAGLSSREVAHQLDRPETGVRQSASRGLRRLRRYAEAIRSRR
jgi:RNA polymerase sigma factor (sigma-70 family)